MQSKVLRGMLKQRASVFSAGGVNSFGEGAARELILDRVLCRFVASGIIEFNTQVGGNISVGNAQLWLDGDANVSTGNVVLAPDGREYRVIRISKPMDIPGTRADHTKCVLE